MGPELVQRRKLEGNIRAKGKIWPCNLLFFTCMKKILLIRKQFHYNGMYYSTTRTHKLSVLAALNGQLQSEPFFLLKKFFQWRPTILAFRFHILIYSYVG